MDQWPRTKLGKFAYDSLTIVVAAIGLYLTVGTIVAGLTVLIGVQYLVFRALFGKPEECERAAVDVAVHAHARRDPPT